MAAAPAFQHDEPPRLRPMNPLLEYGDLPRFDLISAAHVGPAVDQLVAACNAALSRVTADAFPADWNRIACVLDVATEKLGRAWGAVSHLISVADSSELRVAYNICLPKVTEFWTRLGADELLYAKYKAIDPASLTSEQHQARKNALRDFVLGGAELRDDARARFAEIQERQAHLSQKFSENSLDATDGYAYYASERELEGVPEDVRRAALASAQAEHQAGHRLSLKMPCYLPIMQFARDRELRYRLYRASVTRASDQADSDLRRFDNTLVMRELLALRKEEAQLLGYLNFGELSLAPKMAESPRRVTEFLRDLAARVRPFAQQELADLRRFSADELDLPDLQQWDLLYASEKLKEARFAFSENDVKQYFPLPKVLDGLFKIVETLFDVVIRPDQTSVWNRDVAFYRIQRPVLAPTGFSDATNSCEIVGQFYLDPAARNGKRSGAWMDDERGRWMRPDSHTIQTPVAHLVCNFAARVSADGVDRPALLTHDDVITLFHEFGHGLQHLLTEVDERHVSGINGVEWDAVELASQLMENFCWEWGVLKHMSAHVDTAEALPHELFTKMVAARNFQSGLQTLRQIQLAQFDMLLHTEHDPSQDVMPLMRKLSDEFAVLPVPDWSRTAHTFGHVFAGGYAAGYYSYKWAEVLSADAYAAFEESAANDGLPNVQTGRKYRQAILETGGSRPAMESFKAFRGREPRLDALLRHHGMANSVAFQAKD